MAANMVETAELGTDAMDMKTFCLVTGGARGIGAYYSKCLAEYMPAGSVMAILGRNEQKLREHVALIEQNPGIQAVVIPQDLGEVDSPRFNNLLKLVFKEKGLTPSQFEQAILVNNAGNAGDISTYLRGQQDSVALERFFCTNIVSTYSLTSQFLAMFPEGSVRQRFVIGVTTFMALLPFKTGGLMCAMKANTDHMYKCLALEEPSLRVMIYDPGEVRTDLMQSVAAGMAEPEYKELVDYFITGKGAKFLTEGNESGYRMVTLLRENLFESGSRQGVSDELLTAQGAFVDPMEFLTMAKAYIENDLETLEEMNSVSKMLSKYG